MVKINLLSYGLVVVKCFYFRSPFQAEELNTLIGNAFKMAYASQKQQQQPTFHELIERQLQEQRAQFQV